MRTEKEILQLMLEHKELFIYGLCQLSISMYGKTIITDEELSLILSFIEKNKPRNKHTLYSEGECYFWSRGIIRFRINWIKKHIAKLEKEGR